MWEAKLTVKAEIFFKDTVYFNVCIKRWRWNVLNISRNTRPFDYMNEEQSSFLGLKHPSPVQSK